MNALILDDDDLFGSLLTDFLENTHYFNNIYKCLDVESAEEIIANKDLDLIFLDLFIPNYIGMDFLANLKKNQNYKTILLSSNLNYHTVKQGIKHGAFGFLTKRIKMDDIFLSVEEVLKGNIFISEDLQNEIDLHSSKIEYNENIKFQISSRETQILQLISLGKSNKEIAAELCISIHTTETHRKNLLTKLNANSSAHLVRIAIENNLI